MKWIIFTGTWRLTNDEVERDVRQAAREAYESGDGMVSGGATGVDYFALDEFVKLNQDCTRIRVFIPARLDHYIADYRKNWKSAPLSDTDIDKLSVLLKYIQSKNPAAIFEVRKESGDILQAEYDVRHDEEVAFADEVYAFHVNISTGTSDTLAKAVKAGLPVTLHKKYTIEE